MNGTENSYSFRKRNSEKCENHQNVTMFKGSYWASKFQYITRLCETGQNREIYFRIFPLKTKFSFLISWVFIKNVVLCSVICCCSLKSNPIGGGPKWQKLATITFLAPLPFINFLNYNSILYLKINYFFKDLWLWIWNYSLGLKTWIK